MFSADAPDTVHAMLSTRFTELFEVDHPITQGGMQWVGTATDIEDFKSVESELRTVQKELEDRESEAGKQP